MMNSSCYSPKKVSPIQFSNSGFSVPQYHVVKSQRSVIGKPILPTADERIQLTSHNHPVVSKASFKHNFGQKKPSFISDSQMKIPLLNENPTNQASFKHREEESDTDRRFQNLFSVDRNKTPRSSYINHLEPLKTSFDIPLSQVIESQAFRNHSNNGGAATLYATIPPAPAYGSHLHRHLLERNESKLSQCANTEACTKTGNELGVQDEPFKTAGTNNVCCTFFLTLPLMTKISMICQNKF